MWFDRRVSEALLAALEPGGVLASLVDLRNLRRDVLEVQFHRSRRGRRSRAVLHAGPDVVLVIDERGGRFRLRPGAVPGPAPGFRRRWRRWMDTDALGRVWPDVTAFLHRRLAGMDRADLDPVARLCGALVDTHRIVARPAAVRFADTQAESAAPADADLLAVDGDERAIVVAVTGGEPPHLAARRARSHAELFARLFHADPAGVEALAGMAEQRVRVGLDGAPAPVLRRPVAVVPVIAVGAGHRQPDRLARLDAEIDRMEREGGVAGLERPEVWWLDAEGRPEVGHRATAKAPFAVRARASAAAWRRTTTTLPEEVRHPEAVGGGPVSSDDELRLPPAHATSNLLPDARERALERFAAIGRRWPGGEAGGPSPHLLSASVQCANALAPLVDDASGLAAVLDGTVPVARVLPFGAPVTVAGRFGQADHVVFGWAGLSGGSAAGSRRLEAAADAAIRYETAAGDIEIALLAWVYAGDPGRSPGLAANPDPGCRHDPDGPLRTDLVPDADLAVEPFATLLALQCLAWRMEQAAELGAHRVRVVLCAPAGNGELLDALAPVHRQLGGGPGALAHAPVTTVAEAWRALLRRPDRFAFLDTARLVSRDAPTSAEFKGRYRDLADDGPDTGPDAAEGEPADLARWSTSELAELAARLEELAGLVHRLRLEPPPQ